MSQSLVMLGEPLMRDPRGKMPRLSGDYSPVRQVAYKVENTRVGQELDYDKLPLTVDTDGTITPDDAIAYAARILQDQLQLFVHFNEGMTTSSPTIGHAIPSAAEAESDTSQLNRHLLKRIDEFKFSSRVYAALLDDNIVYIGDLVQKAKAEMLRKSDLGRRSITEIEQLLDRMGLRLGMELEDWPPENLEELRRAPTEMVGML